MMLALEMFRSVPRTVAGKAVGGRMPGILSGYAAPLRLVTIEEPKVDRPGWARLRTRLSGICGSDLGALSGQDQPVLLGGRVAAVRARPRGGRRAARGLRGPARRHPRRRRPGPHLRGPRRRAVRELRDRRDQPVLADHRRPPGARPADRLLQGHRRRLGPAAGRAPQPAARGARGLLRRAGDPDRAGRVRRAHRAARRDRAAATGSWSAAPARSGCSPRSRCASSPTPARSSSSPSTRTRSELAREFGATEVVAPGEVLRRVRRSTGAFQLKPEFSVAVPARRRRRRRRRGRQQAVAGDRAAGHPRRRPGRAVRDAGRRRPVGRVVPRARGGRHLRVRPVRRRVRQGARAGRHRRGPAARQVRRQLPVAPLAGSARPRPLRRPSRHGQGGLRPEEFLDESAQVSFSRWTTGPRRCSCTRGWASGWRTSRSAPASSTRRSRCPPCPTSTRRSARRCCTRVDSDPLPELLFAGMRLTIAFDDLSLPLPTMRPPDIRGRIIEHVLTMAAEAGVDDVELIAANALHRRMTAAELKHIVGERVFRSFYPQGKLYNFDAEDRDNLTHLGTTEQGRGHRDQQAGRRVRPARLRQREPRGDGRRPQVGRHRAGVVQVAAAPPQRQDDGALAVVHGPQALRDAPLRLADRPGHQGHGQGLPDRDHAQQRHLPEALRLPAEARVGVVGQGPGLDARRTPRALGRAAEAAAQDVPRPAVGLRADRASTPARSRRCTSRRWRRCTSSTWSRCRASPTCW